MEILASSKEERNTWMQLIQTAVQSMDKDEDEGIPSETEDDKRQLESKAKEIRDMLKQKDTEIISLLEEKVLLFREMWEGLSTSEEAYRQVEPFFRSACSQESIMKDALQEVETLQALLNGSLGGAMASVHEGGGAGPVCLPRSKTGPTQRLQPASPAQHSAGSGGPAEQLHRRPAAVLPSQLPD
ncbi:A-kinase anchor protein 13-like isoform X3 [Cyprinodon tularosa]|uniref:A-kinase anchor protein 13-like isoform X3 n=1 Tax=Cyprinodon tularosa TaxID=77115 RepID=UPI0018E1F14E|nr:A-kinase anchor protein 13-like isoform X3 [Cyprinodon tularosa]